MSSKFQNDAIFWVEVEKIKPNPYQPRRDFNEDRLRDLAESIRQYGVLQPLTVTRKEQVKEDGGLKVEYELIAGERRHRAAQMANLSQVPVIIRSGKEDSQVKLELAIIENLQREDLNPIERAEAFDKLADEFEFTHKQIAEKIGKSREYVSNSMRLLKLPEKIKQAIISGKMTEGHARPIMMLRDKPKEQEMLFKEVVHKGLTVREAESIARRDAQDKVRKKKNKIKPETKALEDRLSDTFGTRVKIEERDVGGKLVIDFFSEEDLENIIKLVQADGDMEMGDMMEQYVKNITSDQEEDTDSEEDTESDSSDTNSGESTADTEGETSMADTLSSMIAAARQKQKEKNKQATPDVDSGKEDDTAETTVSNQQESTLSESSATQPKDYTTNTDKVAEQSTDESTARKDIPQPQASTNTSDREPKGLSQNNLSDDALANTNSSTENKERVSETIEEKDDGYQDTEASTIAPQETSSEAVAETQDTEAENSSENNNDTDKEKEEGATAADDEMYAVSNFSI